MLEDRVRDGERVNRLLEALEALSVIHVIRDDSSALDFFASQARRPFAVIVYMNSKSAVGLCYGSNYRLLKLPTYGMCRLREFMYHTMTTAKGIELDVLTFLADLTEFSLSAPLFDN